MSDALRKLNEASDAQCKILADDRSIEEIAGYSYIGGVSAGFGSGRTSVAWMDSVKRSFDRHIREIVADTPDVHPGSWQAYADAFRETLFGPISEIVDARPPEDQPDRSVLPTNIEVPK